MDLLRIPAQQLSLFPADPQTDSAAGPQDLEPLKNQRVMIAHGSGGNGVEKWRWVQANEILQPFGPNIHGVKPASSRYFLQEGALFGHRLEQRRLEAREQNPQRQTGKSRATAHVEQAAHQLDSPGQEQTLAKMAGYGLFEASNRRQIDFLVPTREELEVSEERADLIWAQAKLKGC